MEKELKEVLVVISGGGDHGFFSPLILDFLSFKTTCKNTIIYNFI